jgi:hypothetical protein
MVGFWSCSSNLVQNPSKWVLIFGKATKNEPSGFLSFFPYFSALLETNEPNPDCTYWRCLWHWEAASAHIFGAQNPVNSGGSGCSET